MRDVDDRIRHLRGPESQATAPAWPATRAPARRSPRAWAFAVLAVAAALLLLVSARPNIGVLRGEPGAAEVDLRVSVARGGVATRASVATTYEVGERVYFRVGASQSATVHVWVVGPEGTEPIAHVQAGPVPADLADGEGLVAYALDRRGVYVFYASAEGDGVCRRCATSRLEVR